MNTAILLAAAFFAAASAVAPRTPPSPAPARAQPGPSTDGDPCRDLDTLAEPATCGSAPLCSARRRARIACALRDAMQSRYVFQSVKSRMLAAEGRAFDPRGHLDACAAAERAIPHEDAPLRFYDRMRRCTAAFEDGHLMLSVPQGVPQVALGVALRLDGQGHVRVAHRDPGLVAALDAASRTAGAPGARALGVGTRVLAVDGRPVEAVLRELGALVPASSEGARRERAVDALTRRSFAFPTHRTATLTVQRPHGRTEDVQLAWWLSPGGETHPLTAAWARRTGVTSTTRVDWRPEARGAWLREGDSEGLLRGDPIVPPDAAAHLQAWRGDRGQLAARLGELEPSGAPRFCYAQLLTFHTETLSDGDEPRPFMQVLEGFVRGCGARHLDLVLDLRQNEGGYIDHSTALAALLTPPHQRSPGGALVVRATAQTERVYRERAPMLGGEPDGARREVSGPGRVLRAIEDARRDGREFTPAFFDAPLRSSAAFDGRVVALVSPACMSACDRLAGMLRSGGRAVLVGGPTEGAGASQQETRDLSARWIDPDEQLAVSIPNAAMGVQPALGRARGATAEEFFSALALENRPVQPHVFYATDLGDLTGHGRGWLAQTLSALRRAGSVAPTAGSR